MKVVIPVAILLCLSGCGLVPRFQTPFSAVNPMMDQVTTGTTTKTEVSATGETTSTTTSIVVDQKQIRAKRFVDAYQAAATSPTDATTIRTFVSSGISFSQALCQDYFVRLSSTKAQRDFARRETNLGGGLTASLLGLGKVASSQVAGVAALFSFGEASFEAYDESFLVSPNVAALEQLVRRKQQEEEIIIYRRLNAEKGLRWPDRIESFYEAERSLNDYIFHCTVNGLRTLLEQSVNDRARSVEENNRRIQGPDSAASAASTLTRR